MNSKTKENMTWLITGGTGFLGLHLCRFLKERKQKIIAYDIAPLPENEKIEGCVEIIADIRDTASLQKALKNVDIVVHCAAALPLASSQEINSINFEGTIDVLNCSKTAGVKRFIYIGTTAVYGMPKHHPINETTPFDPMGSYGIAKSKADLFIQESQGIEWIILRPKSFIGTGRLGIFQILFDWIESGRKIPVFGTGNNHFQLLWVEDLLEAIYRSALYAPSNNIYNIGAKEFSTVNIDMRAMLKSADTGSRLVHLPSKPIKAVLRILEILHLSPVYRWVYDTADQDSFVSIEKAEKDFQFAPQYSNQRALIETYQWYLKEGKMISKNTGTGHRVAWKQGILNIVKHFF